MKAPAGHILMQFSFVFYKTVSISAISVFNDLKEWMDANRKITKLCQKIGKFQILSSILGLFLVIKILPPIEILCTSTAQAQIVQHWWALFVMVIQ